MCGCCCRAGRGQGEAPGRQGERPGSAAPHCRGPLRLLAPSRGCAISCNAIASRDGGAGLGKLARPNAAYEQVAGAASHCLRRPRRPPGVITRRHGSRGAASAAWGAHGLRLQPAAPEPAGAARQQVGTKICSDLPRRRPTRALAAGCRPPARLPPLTATLPCRPAAAAPAPLSSQPQWPLRQRRRTPSAC